MDNKTYDFGLRLKCLRKRKKLTQKQVAEIIKVGDKMISDYERNVAVPGYETLTKLANLYGAPLDYIAGIDNRPFIYLGDMPKDAQELATDVVDRIKQDYLPDREKENK